MNKKIRTEAVDFLFDAILSLQNKEECYTFSRMYARSMSYFLFHSASRSRRCCGSRRPIWR